MLKRKNETCLRVGNIQYKALHGLKTMNLEKEASLLSVFKFWGWIQRPDGYLPCDVCWDLVCISGASRSAGDSGH